MHLYIYTHHIYIYIWSGVWRSQPPPPMVWSGRGWGGGGGWRVRKRAGVVGAATGGAARAHTNLYFLNRTPNPKPRLNAGSKPKAEHTLQILPKPLSTRSLIPFNRKPKTHKLKLNPKPQNPHNHPTGGRGKREPTLHPTGGGASWTIDHGGGGGRGGAAERVTIYIHIQNASHCRPEF